MMMVVMRETFVEHIVVYLSESAIVTTVLRCVNLSGLDNYVEVRTRSVYV